jgi:hypothetical protein
MTPPQLAQGPDLLIYIPGYTGGKARGWSLSNLLRPGIELGGATTSDLEPVAGCAAVTIKSPFTPRTIEAFEIPWEADMHYLSDEPNPMTKLTRGVELALYWAFSPIWNTFWESPGLGLSLLYGFAVLLIWLGIVAYQVFSVDSIV